MPEQENIQTIPSVREMDHQRKRELENADELGLEDWEVVEIRRQRQWQSEW